MIWVMVKCVISTNFTISVLMSKYIFYLKFYELGVG